MTQIEFTYSRNPIQGRTQVGSSWATNCTYHIDKKIEEVTSFYGPISDEIEIDFRERCEADGWALESFRLKSINALPESYYMVKVAKVSA